MPQEKIPVGTFDLEIIIAIKKGNTKFDTLLKEVFPQDEKDYYRYLDRALQKLRKQDTIAFEKGNWKIKKEAIQTKITQVKQ
jgi:hypothetical protein